MCGSMAWLGTRRRHTKCRKKQAATALQRLERFAATASPEAQELARYFATVPLTLPVMRLTQQTLLPLTRQAHLAEVFLSGLLRRNDGDKNKVPLQVLLDFHPGIRELLLDELPQLEVERAARRMSRVIESHLGQSLDFLAMLTDDEGKLPLNASTLPIARIRLSVLRRLGGQYSEMAAQLVEHIETLEIRQFEEVEARSGTDKIFHKAAEILQPEFKLCDLFPDGTPAPAMVWLPGGTFKMGDVQGIGDANERPVHEVTLDAFSIGHYPVTFDDYDRFCEATGREKPDDQNWGRSRHPVINVSWENAQAYCEWLSRETQAEYRLPTEAEWEYACRAGSETVYCYGNDEERLVDYAWYKNNAGDQPHSVCQKQPNAWELYDMHGNVWEWAIDWQAGDYSTKGKKNVLGTGALNTTSPPNKHVIRGGYWGALAINCRSASRVQSSVDKLGFQPKIKHILGPNQKMELIERLLECPSIRNVKSRSILLRELPPHIAKAIKASDTPKVHVLNIVDTCMNYDKGIESLLELLRFFEANTIPFQNLTAFIDQNLLNASADPMNIGFRLARTGKLEHPYPYDITAPEKADQTIQNLTQEAPKSIFYALLVGINECAASTIKNIGGCVNDVAAVEQLLRDKFNVPQNNIHKLITEHQTIKTTFREHLIDKART